MDDDAFDYGLESRDNDISNGKNAGTENVSSGGENDDRDCDYDIWSIINNKMDNENLSADARTNKRLAHFWYFIRCWSAWHRDRFYKAILVMLKKAQDNKKLSFQKALKYAIRQMRLVICKKNLP